MALVVALAASSTLLGSAGLDLTAAGAPSPSPRPPSVLPAASDGPTAEPSPPPRPTPGPPGLPTGYVWPVDHARITTWFGPFPDQPFLVNGQSFHDGIDIASFCGDQVQAAHDGVVLVAGRHVDRWLGWVGSYDAHIARLDAKDLWSSLPILVIVDDGDGYRSLYMHLAKATVKAGQHVKAGEMLGYEGRTGRASGCHLHYSLFDPDATEVYQTTPSFIQRYALPGAEVARIDPLLVLPPMAGASVTWGWGARD